MVLRKVDGVANSILAKIKHVSDLVRLTLIEFFVFPVMIYGLKAIGPVQFLVSDIAIVLKRDDKLQLTLVQALGLELIPVYRQSARR